MVSSLNDLVMWYFIYLNFNNLSLLNVLRINSWKSDYNQFEHLFLDVGYIKILATSSIIIVLGIFENYHPTLTILFLKIKL